MTTTAFQTVFDKAALISMNKRAVVAQTMSRNQTVRSVSRGGQVWRFDVKMPDGVPWIEMRGLIEAMDKADRSTVGNVQINRAGYNNWLGVYQGNCVGMTANVTTGDTVTLASVTSGTVAFKAGDFVQMGNNGHVYTVVTDVAYSGGATVTLNRPVLETAGTYNLITGPGNIVWSVICTDFPSWTINPGGYVSWSGSFKFNENLV